MVNFVSYLKVNAQKVNQELDKILLPFLADVKKISPKLTPLVKEFIKSCQGGKRIRGVLTKLGYEIAGGKGNQIYKVGAALEIMHTAILVHDDIIDDSPTRRGHPSLYIAVGEYQAITLGDLGFFLASKILAETAGNKAIMMFSKTMINTAFGQMLDIAKDDPLTIAKLKTARYTIADPMRLGAMLGGGNEQLLGWLEMFGQQLGIAFQIRDDILDGESDDHSLAQALAYANQAKKLIPKIISDPKMAQLLMGMADYMIERTK